MAETDERRPPFPPFTLATATEKVRLAEDGWHSRGRSATTASPSGSYEWHDDGGHWFRSYGNENWEFGDDGLMRVRHASINDLPIAEADRRYHWPLGRRPDDHPGLSDLGL